MSVISVMIFLWKDQMYSKFIFYSPTFWLQHCLLFRVTLHIRTLWLWLAKQVLIFWGIKIQNFCLQVLKSPGSYMWVFTVHASSTDNIYPREGGGGQQLYSQSAYAASGISSSMQLCATSFMKTLPYSAGGHEADHSYAI